MAEKGGSINPALRLLSELDALGQKGFKYLVIGGTASVLYGVKRATFDIDIGIAASSGKLDLLLGMLKRLGYRSIVDPSTGEQIASINEVDGQMLRQMASFGAKNGHQVDILLIGDEDFEFMWKYKVEVRFGDVAIPIPTLLDLIRMKERSSRPVDIEDVKHLKHILRTGKGRKKD